MKLGKIVDVVRSEDRWSKKPITKCKLIRVEKNSWYSGYSGFARGARPSYITNFDNVVKITDIPEDVLKLFEEEE